DTRCPAGLEPEVGLEPTAFRLRVGCATTTPLGLAERVGVEAECIEGGWRRAREIAIGWAGGPGGGGGCRRRRRGRRWPGTPGRRGGCWGRLRGSGGGRGACAG